MEDIKQKFLEWVVGNMEYGYLYEDVTDDGDGIFQLTGEGEDVVDFIEQELDKAREEGIREYIGLLQAIEHYEGLKMVRGLIGLGLDKHEKRDYDNIQRRFKELSKLKDNK